MLPPRSDSILPSSPSILDLGFVIVQRILELIPEEHLSSLVFLTNNPRLNAHRNFFKDRVVEWIYDNHKIYPRECISENLDFFLKFRDLPTELELPGWKFKEFNDFICEERWIDEKLVWKKVSMRLHENCFLIESLEFEDGKYVYARYRPLKGEPFFHDSMMEFDPEHEMSFAVLFDPEMDPIPTFFFDGVRGYVFGSYIVSTSYMECEEQFLDLDIPF